MGCCGGVTRSGNGPINIGIIGGIKKIEDKLDNFRGMQDIADSIKSHKTAIDVAINTGDMSQVRQVNEEWFSNEMREVENYMRIIDG